MKKYSLLMVGRLTGHNIAGLFGGTLPHEENRYSGGTVSPRVLRTQRVVQDVDNDYNSCQTYNERRGLCA